MPYAGNQSLSNLLIKEAVKSVNGVMEYWSGVVMEWGMSGFFMLKFQVVITTIRRGRIILNCRPVFTRGSYYPEEW